MQVIMPCALEINNKDGIKRERVKSYLSATTNFITSLALGP